MRKIYEDLKKWKQAKADVLDAEKDLKTALRKVNKFAHYGVSAKKVAIDFEYFTSGASPTGKYSEGRYASSGFQRAFNAWKEAKRVSAGDGEKRSKEKAEQYFDTDTRLGSLRKV